MRGAAPAATEAAVVPDPPMSWIVVRCRKELPGFTLDARWESSRPLVGLVGRSGSGKTLTLRCIAGLERPDEGEIRLRDQVLFDARRGVDLPVHHRRVGFVFQHYALFPHLTVRQNVLFGHRSPGEGSRIGVADGPAQGPRGARASGGEREAAVRELLALCRLEGLEARHPRELSGGQRQRVAIARALATRPAALLLDEPFAALDRQTRDELLGELRTILERSGTPAVLVTHDVGEARALADEVIAIEAGRTAGA